MLKLRNKVVCVNGRRTSMRMCAKEWNAFDEVCKKENISKTKLLGLIEKYKKDTFGLTYSTRLFILSYFRLASLDNKNNLEEIIASLLED